MGHKEEATSLDIDFSLAASRRLWTLLDAERLRLPPILYSQLLREVVEVLGLSDDASSVPHNPGTDWAHFCSGRCPPRRLAPSAR